jgi:hypothetical protein
MAVWRRSHDYFRSYIAAGTWPIFDDNRLVEPFRQRLSYQACDDVRRKTGWKADDNTHRPRRVALRPGDPRHGRQRGSARGQMKEFAAGKFHGVTP